MADLGTVLWLRWRQVSRAGLYWLAVIGYDPAAGALLDRVYGFYVLGAVLAIGVVGWAGAVHAAAQAASGLGTVGAAPLLRLVPAAVLAVQTLLVTRALAHSPLQLTAADMAHVAGAPLRRAAVVGSAFLRALPLRLLVSAAVGDLASILLAGSLHHQGAGAATAVLLTWFSLALSWLFGMLRLAGAPRPRAWLWPLPPLAAALLLWRWPGAALWPGHALAAALSGHAPAWNVPLALSAAAASLALVAAGDRANMSAVARESGLFARLAALGALALTDPGAARRIRLQEVQARRRPILALPPVAGFRLLPARAALAYLRRPAVSLWLLRDLALTVSGCWLLLGHGAGLPWFDWVFACAAIPPRGLGDVFADDTREPFLRQLLPVDDLTLLAGEAGPGALLLLLLSAAAWLLRRPPGSTAAAGFLCAAVLIALRGLCQAVAPARAREGVWRPPFVAAAGVCFGLMAVAAVPGHAPGLALALGAALTVGLGLLAARA